MTATLELTIPSDGTRFCSNGFEFNAAFWSLVCRLTFPEVHNEGFTSLRLDDSPGA